MSLTKPRLYMDSCCFIDMAKQKAGILPTGRANDVWYLRKLLEARKDGAIEIYTSVLTVAECTHADGSDSQQIRDLFTHVLTSGQYLVLVQPTPFVAADARDLRWKHSIKLRGMDAIHVASALHMKCTELLTTDGKIAGQAAKIATLGLRVAQAPNTKLLPESYLQESMLDEKIAPFKSRKDRAQKH